MVCESHSERGSAQNRKAGLFTEEPGTVAMTGLPWIMVPAILVPLYLFIHFAIAAKVRSLRPLTHAAAMAR